jgi:hypothetical protein
VETSGGRAFRDSKVELVDVGSAEIAYRRFGAGPPLLLVHGWPLTGLCDEAPLAITIASAAASTAAR